MGDPQNVVFGLHVSESGGALVQSPDSWTPPNHAGLESLEMGFIYLFFNRADKVWALKFENL